MAEIALRRRHLGRTWRGILLVITVCMVTAAVGLAIAGTSRGARAHGPAPRTGGILSGPGAPNAAQPLIQAEKVKPTDAQREVGFPVPIPDATAANPENLTQAWVKPAWRQAALVFDRGKVTIMMWPALYRNPVQWFRTFIAENHAKITIGKVSGGPALVIAPRTDFYRSNPAWVEFERGRVDVNIVSSVYGTKTLLAVADSMR
jgi:hypothetical protein